MKTMSRSSTPNTPHHYPVEDQPNTPAMESVAMAIAEENHVDPHATPSIKRTEAEIEAGRTAVERHREAHESAREAARAADEASAADADNCELNDDVVISDDSMGLTPVTLEDGSQARVPKRVADAARSRDRHRSRDLGAHPENEVEGSKRIDGSEKSDRTDRSDRSGGDVTQPIE